MTLRAELLIFISNRQSCGSQLSLPELINLAGCRWWGIALAQSEISTGSKKSKTPAKTVPHLAFYISHRILYLFFTAHAYFTMADSTPSPCRMVVMASGNGSNFQALINAVASGQIPNTRITRLYVNRSKAYATKRAEEAGTFNLHSI